MKIVVTNDDGIDAPGLQALAAAASEYGEAVVVAPQRAHSGCGHQATVDRPLTLDERGGGRWSVDGTPVDCVRLALLHLAVDADWVVAGVNDGANLGVDIHMSGTVAAAREAALLGKKAIAVSHYRRTGQALDWTRAAVWAAGLLRHLFDQSLEPGDHWNVNFPADNPGGTLPTLVECPLDPHPLPVRYREADGRFHYHTPYHERQRKSGADVDVCFQGSVAITRLTLPS